MRRIALVAALTALVAACGQAPAASVHVGASPSASSSAGGSAAASPSSHPSAAASTLPTPSQATATLTGNYGIVIAGGEIELVKPDASIATRSPIGASSVVSCSSSGDGAMEAPPVSASSSQVYFRDGDTQISRMSLTSGATNVTTVPGGPTTVSFFSVSPDDQRIAVVVEDLSAATTISLRLYVEDLVGHGHHADIFTTTQPKGKTGTTLWPMGWHNGALVLAVVVACTFEPAGLTPSSWHISNASTAVRIATINASNCTLSLWPSPAGVGCTAYSSGATTLYDWSGKVISVTGPGSTGSGYTMTGLSPAGNSIFFATGAGIGAPAPATGIVQLGPGPYATVPGHMACEWIDEDHLLAPDGVIQFPAETAGNVRVNAGFTAFRPGVCAGHFPGGL
jgi:hypothetical protein